MSLHTDRYRLIGLLGTPLAYMLQLHEYVQLSGLLWWGWTASHRI